MFIWNVLSVDLWKIPHLENIDESPNFSRVSSKYNTFLWLYGVIIITPYNHCMPTTANDITLREYRGETKLLKSFIWNERHVRVKYY